LRVLTVLALAGFAMMAVVSAFATTTGTPPFKIETVAPGVYVAVSLDPLGLANHSNAVFIVNDEDVVLVDTQFTLERTRMVLDAIRRLTDKPVTVLVNTHWHDDHTFGNQVITDAFPQVDIVAQTLTREDMLGIGVANRKQQVEGGPDALAFFRSCIDKKTNVNGAAMSDDELAAYQSTVVIVTEYLGEQMAFRLTVPTTTFDDRLVLKRGKRTIDILYFGPAVTRGDAVVYLPAEGVLVAGDVVDNPLPFAYGCNVTGWIAALDSIRELNPRVIVPGHGAVMRDMSGVDRLSRLLTSVRDQTRAAVAQGDSLSQVQAGVRVDDVRASVVGKSRMMEFLFDGFFLRPAVQSAFNEATGK